MQRRQLIIGLGLAPLLTPSLVEAAARPDDKEGKESEIDLLFVQSARGASLSRGRLRLEGVAAATIYFSDRPKRIAGHVPSKVFIGHWGEGGKDSFEADPPNGTLSILESDEPREIVVELMNPRWDGHDLIYDVKVLEGD